METFIVTSIYLALKSLSDLVDGLGDLCVLHARLDQPQGGLGGQVGRHYDISLAPSHRGLGCGAQHPGVSHHCDEAVNVGPEVKLDQVTISEAGVRLRQERRVVADDVVDRDASREGDT